MMIETVVLIALAAVVGIFHDTNKPTEYELSMEDGSKTNLVLQKNSHYACPLYCEVDHSHHAVVYDNEKSDTQNSVYHIYAGVKNTSIMYYSDQKILSMNKLTKKSKVSPPDVINASKEK